MKRIVTFFIRRNPYFSLLVFITTGTIFTYCTSEKSANRKVDQEILPNIVFILADDLGYGDLTCYNSDSKIPTPHLDRLAEEGMRFIDAHTPSSVCSPTRYGLLTGRYCWRTPLQKNVLQSWDLPLIKDSVETLPEVLKKAGYHTAHIGKWHLGFRWQLKEGLPTEWRINELWRKGEIGENIDFSNGIQGGPMDAGFDYSFGFDAPNIPPYCFWENGKIVGDIPSIPRPDSMYGERGPMQAGWDLQDVFPALERQALRYLQDQSTGKQPFFLYFALTAPHVPLLPTKASEGKSQAGLYGDFVVDVDALVGKIRSQLVKSGLAENTIVIFASDNGSPGRVEDPVRGRNYCEGSGEIIRQYGHYVSGPWRGLKGDTWEGGHRVPLIVHWPGEIEAGTINPQTVCLTDWITFAYRLTDAEKPANQAIDSYDLMTTLKNPEQSIREHIVHHSANGYFAIRKDNWKLILTKGAGSGYSAWYDPEGEENEYEGQLYNLKDDPKEQNNLYGKYPDKVIELTGLLKQIKGL